MAFRASHIDQSEYSLVYSKYGAHEFNGLMAAHCTQFYILKESVRGILQVWPHP